jgi:hypothetical protein
MTLKVGEYQVVTLLSAADRFDPRWSKFVVGRAFRKEGRGVGATLNPQGKRSSKQKAKNLWKKMLRRESSSAPQPGGSIQK